MSSAPGEPSQICPQCGAHAMACVARCWKCGAELTGAIRADNAAHYGAGSISDWHTFGGGGAFPSPAGAPAASRVSSAGMEPVPATPAVPAFTFGLKSIFAAMTCAAVLATVIAYAPTAGIALSILAVPIALRILWVKAASAAAGRPLDGFGYVVAGFLSLLIVTVTIVCSLLAFMAGYGFVLFFGGRLAAVVGGVVAALLVAIPILYGSRDVGTGR